MELYKEKIVSFLPYYLMATIFQVVFLNIKICHNSLGDVVFNLAKGSSRLLFFDSWGINMSNNVSIGVDWYLSVMISALVILLPILLYNYEWASKIIFPIIGLFGLGVLFINFGNISVHEKILLLLFEVQMIRGLCNIALGVWGYEMALTIKSWNLTKLSKILFTMLKWVCLFSVIAFSYYHFSKKYSAVAVLLCLIAVALSFSDNTYNIPYNSFTGFLGKLSLSIYLTHFVIKKMCVEVLGENVEIWKIWVVIMFLPVFAYVFMIITDFICMQIKKTKHLFINE